MRRLLASPGLTILAVTEEAKALVPAALAAKIAEAVAVLAWQGLELLAAG